MLAYSSQNKPLLGENPYETMNVKQTSAHFTDVTAKTERSLKLLQLVLERYLDLEGPRSPKWHLKYLLGGIVRSSALFDFWNGKLMRNGIFLRIAKLGVIARVIWG